MLYVHDTQYTKGSWSRAVSQVGCLMESLLFAKGPLPTNQTFQGMKVLRLPKRNVWRIVRNSPWV